ncbi:hypothetical protein VP1G_05356 [Cytospora mali]|uniref:Uncharacterized protein n=1 Tax=Cytospora mali TaxID=578113 RepID=A0A194V2E9_CYTMA|nr:hypothetical protein VP1G_05356 [Valsa mali var. pyri (nom. inval.)]
MPIAAILDEIAAGTRYTFLESGSRHAKFTTTSKQPKPSINGSMPSLQPSTSTPPQDRASTAPLPDPAFRTNDQINVGKFGGIHDDRKTMDYSDAGVLLDMEEMVDEALARALDGTSASASPNNIIIWTEEEITMGETKPPTKTDWKAQLDELEKERGWDMQTSQNWEEGIDDDENLGLKQGGRYMGHIQDRTNVSLNANAVWCDVHSLNEQGDIESAIIDEDGEE